MFLKQGFLRSGTDLISLLILLLLLFLLMDDRLPEKANAPSLQIEPIDEIWHALFLTICIRRSANGAMPLRLTLGLSLG